MEQDSEGIQDEGTDSIPTAPEKPPRPTSVKALWLAVALLVIAVVAALSSAVHTYRAEQRRRAQAATAPAFVVIKDREVGQEDAKLKVEACLGPCIASLFLPFAECAEAWPDKLRAEFYAYDSPEGQKFCADHGEDLACICFNGEDRFTLGEGDSSREVHFYGPPGGGYTVRDLAEVLRMQMEEVHGDLPPDFDEKAAAFLEGSGHPGPPEEP
jgi:hypothetical protein